MFQVFIIFLLFFNIFVNHLKKKKPTTNNKNNWGQKIISAGRWKGRWVNNGRLVLQRAVNEFGKLR